MSLSIADIAKEHSRFIYNVIEDIERSFHPAVTEDEELIRRALFAVRNKAMVFERYVPMTDSLYVSVQDVRPMAVTINFQHKKIICTCPQDGWCRHKVSTILSLYQYLESIQDWAAKWREKKNASLHELATDRSPDNWKSMVDEVMGHILKDDTQIDSFMISTIADNAKAKLNKFLPYEREWQPLYHIFMELAILYKIWQHTMKTKSPVHSGYFEYFIDNRIELLQNHINETTAKSRLFAMDPFYNELQKMVRNVLVKCENHVLRRMNIFLLFWDTIFIEKSRAENELAYFKTLENSNEHSNDASPEIIENVFHILLKNYDTIKINMKSIDEQHLLIYFGLAKFAVSRNDQIASEIILRAILPFLNKFINNTISPSHRQMYVKKINKLYENINLSEQEEMTLFAAYGVYGIQPYSNYLLKHKRYKDWVALHQLYPSSISYLESCGLKEVIEEAPGATLPLYHFYAMEEVRQKSRMNYKQAVRIWKMMKAAAKKSGKMNFWKDYIHSVSEQHKRLRALQEELEKGNLFV